MGGLPFRRSRGFTFRRLPLGELDEDNEDRTTDMTKRERMEGKLREQQRKKGEGGEEEEGGNGVRIW